MSGRPLLLVTLPVLTVVAICLYLRRRGRSDSDPPEPPAPDRAPAGGSADAEPEPAAVRAAPLAAQPAEAARSQPDDNAPEPAVKGDALSALEAAIQPASQREQPPPEAGDAPAQATEPAGAETDAVTESEEPQTNSQEPQTNGQEPRDSVQEPAITKEDAPTVSSEAPAVSAVAPAALEATQQSEAAPEATQQSEAAPEATQQPEAAQEATQQSEAVPEPSGEAAAAGAEAAEPPAGGAAETGADTASESSSDSGKGGSSASLEQASPATSPESAPMQTTVYDFLIPQKLCGRLIGKNGTFVNMLKARTGAHVIIRLHPVKSSVKICSVDGTQSEIDACLKLIREKFPVNKFPAMTLEQLNRPSEQALAVPDSQQLHLPQGVTCDVLVSAVVTAGQLFLQQHTHPTFRGLERLTTLMAACYGDGGSTPELPRPVVASSICAAPVAGGWYRAQVVAYYPDSDEMDVRFMDFGGYSRLPAALARQIRTDFMSLPFQAEECYLANVMPVSEDGWSLEAGAVFESLITDRALEAMVVGYAEDGTPFVNLYSIQGTEYGNNAITLVNQRLVESGAARWVELQA
ncbi:A-kinase anchor protein 1, mitochondrial [Amphibalanus amphitrite]|uniref:A-kinase anchor protein 1, mitochondrial n=1 Tax=Amphibalanus amphitrite TaxID=1232801 RepID=A0A6A4W9S0_AMPAM|nr:A-kinase anchor protein 1, mitochondrial-like [Amphibalanus amphitrite]XP_043191380.1 A-kinase anchor protein 1, mitochondrial-like [Amphibalanus amphitrite]XP_043191382.1 A-kinase anchor protein 1, mitochondrial-like [Amphibalanus amphitrite]KAF0301919.1 A-kinase anchor protein 1, mitochondrial [Amphibalanus amphitrite]